MNIDTFIDSNLDGIKLFLAFLLIFIIGFSSGYYYKNSSSVSEGVVVNNSAKNCADLFLENSNTVLKNTGSVMGVSDSQEITENYAVSSEKKNFVASRNSNLYHKANCPYVKRIKENNLIWYDSSEDAEKVGKQPHDCVYE